MLGAFGPASPEAALPFKTLGGLFRLEPDLVAGVEFGAVVGEEAGAIGGKDKIGGLDNCVNCAIAADATLAGRPASALGGRPYRINVLEKIFGGRFGSAGSIGTVSDALSAAGPSARGIVLRRVAPVRSASLHDAG